MAVTEVIVCTTCRPTGASRELLAEGQALLHAVQEAAVCYPDIRVRGVACMSGCSRACTLALQAPGKHSYLFGDLVADLDTAAQVLRCAQMHQRSPDGSLPRNERPERLRSGILARLPPIGSIADSDA